MPVSELDDALAAREQGGGAPERVSLPYEPALDGLRGLAVAGVLLFHGGFEWARGGYLGVSTFFTLSGFLITSLLLAERRTTGGVSLRAFWIRRVRRLMPASLAALALACAFGALAADPAQVAGLRGDVLAALAYVANWRFIADGQSYAELFSGPSPVLQFWSLAIEEQFYAVYPLVVAGLLAGAARRTGGADGGARRLTVVLGAATVASVALSASGVLSDDVVYLSTPTRAAELLVGCLLAVALARPGARDGLARPGPARALAVAGPLAVLVALGAWSTVGQGSGWLYRGGFAAYSLLSAVIVASCLAPGPVRGALSWEPLRRLGLVSYGLYLYHWPVFLWIDASTDLEGWPRFALGASVALVLALASARWLENPVRRDARVSGVRASVLAPLGVVAVLVGALAVTTDPPRPLIDEEAARERLEEAQAANVSPTPGGDTGSVDPGVPRVAIYGDSTAMVLSLGFFTWVAEHPEMDGGAGYTGLGCPIGRGGDVRAGAAEATPEPWCSWSESWVPQAAADGHDVAVVLAGPWDVSDRRLEGTDGWVHIGQPAYDAWLLDELLGVTDAFAAQGSEVVWLTSPPIIDEMSDMPRRDATADPARMDRWNELLHEVAAARPGTAHVIDLAGWLEASGRDREYRPDGIHLSEEGSYDATASLLGPAILELWEQERGSPSAGGD